VRKLSALPMRSEVVQRGVAVEGAMVVVEAAFSQQRKREMGGGGSDSTTWTARGRQRRGSSGHSRGSGSATEARVCTEESRGGVRCRQVGLQLQ
jgi:hypothetical protein